MRCRAAVSEFLTQDSGRLEEWQALLGEGGHLAGSWAPVQAPQVRESPVPLPCRLRARFGDMALGMDQQAEAECQLTVFHPQTLGQAPPPPRRPGGAPHRNGSPWEPGNPGTSGLRLLAFWPEGSYT